MNTYEQAKKNVARAEELAQAVKDGKTVRCFCDGIEMNNGNVSEDDFFQSLAAGTNHRILEPKRRRPLNLQEARALIGCVITGHGDAGDYIADPGRLKLGTCWLESMADDAAHCHPAGQPDDFKPCWVEE